MGTIMRTSLLIATLCAVIFGHPTLAGMTGDEIRTKPTTEVETKLPSEHPASYYLYAMRLFEDDRKDDAVFWFTLANYVIAFIYMLTQIYPLTAILHYWPHLATVSV